MTVSEKERRYDEFFRLPLATLNAEHRLDSFKKGEGGRWHGFDSGVPGVVYRIAVVQGKIPAVRLVIDRDQYDWNHWLFDALLQRRQSIEPDISGRLEWDCVQHRRRCIVSHVDERDFDDQQESWPELQAWMVDGLVEFRRAFDPHLTELAR